MYIYIFFGRNAVILFRPFCIFSLIFPTRSLEKTALFSQLSRRVCGWSHTASFSYMHYIYRHMIVCCWKQSENGKWKKKRHQKWPFVGVHSWKAVTCTSLRRRPVAWRQGHDSNAIYSRTLSYDGERFLNISVARLVLIEFKTIFFLFFFLWLCFFFPVCRQSTEHSTQNTVKLHTTKFWIILHASVFYIRKYELNTIILHRDCVRIPNISNNCYKTNNNCFANKGYYVKNYLHFFFKRYIATLKPKNFVFFSKNPATINLYVAIQFWVVNTFK